MPEQMDLLDLVQSERAPLVFVTCCSRCGPVSAPVPAEGPGESWKTAEQWAYLGIVEHRKTCPKRETAS